MSNETVSRIKEGKAALDDAIEGLRVIQSRRGYKIQQGDVMAIDRAINLLLATSLTRFAETARPEGEPMDKVRLDWLEEQVVNVIHLDDGRIIDVRGNSTRKAIDAAIGFQEPQTPQPDTERK